MYTHHRNTLFFYKHTQAKKALKINTRVKLVADGRPPSATKTIINEL